MSEAATPTRFRSPPYPTLPLQRALERAEQLYRQERDHAVPLASAARAWGASPTSSGPVVLAAALRQYGLIEYDGAASTKKMRLTHDALRMILDKVPTSSQRQEALRRAFLNPKIFSELWEKWKDNLPSDQTMINYLVLERRIADQAPYSERSATELLANYRASLAFAAPSEAPNVPLTNDENTELGDMNTPVVEAGRPEGTAQRAPAQAHSLHSAAIRLAENERVVFVEEGEPNQYLKLVASGELDEIMLDALSDYINRQKRRLGRST